MTTEALVRRFVVLRALRWLPFGLALPFFVLLPEDRGLGLAAIGLVWGTHSVVVLLLEVPSGALADAVGRRATLLVGGAIGGAGLAGFAFATGLGGFLAATAAIALGRALASGALEAWFVDALREREPQAPLHAPLAAGTRAEAIGLAVGAAAGGLIPLLPTGLDATGGATLVELSVPVLAGAALALLHVVAVARYVEEAPRPRAARRRVVGETMAMTRTGLLAARRSHNVRRVLGIAAAVGVAMSSVELLWQPRLEDLLDRHAAGAAPLFGGLVASSMLAVALGSTVCGRIAGRLDKRRLFAGSCVLLGATLGGLALAGTVVLFCGVYLLFYAALGFSDPLHNEILHDAIEGPVRATVVSAEQLTMQAGGAGGNLALGPLAAAAGFGVAWAVPAVLCVGAAMLAASTRAAPQLAATPPPRPAAPSGAV